MYTDKKLYRVEWLTLTQYTSKKTNFTHSYKKKMKVQLISSTVFGRNYHYKTYLKHGLDEDLNACRNRYQNYGQFNFIVVKHSSFKGGMVVLQSYLLN